jgi:long-chain acyl-CoA synthetase
MSNETPEWRAAEAAYADDTDEVIGNDTLPRLFEAAAERHAGLEAQWYKGGIYDRSLVDGVVPAAPDGQYAALTYGEMRDVVGNLAAGFRELGLETGDRAGIFADTRMEWAQSDLALLAAGGVVTTVYTESSRSQVEYLLSDPDADGVVVENGELLQRVLDVEDTLDLEFVVVIDEFDGYEDRDDIYTLAAVHDLGAAAFDRERYEGWLDERDLDDLASLIYTSGTTGKPKGVMLTQGNLRANINQVRRRFAPRPDRDAAVPSLSEGDRSLSFLPLAHVFERMAGHYLMFATGATVAYAESADTVAEDIALVRPTVATSVPRVYERIYDSMREQASESAFKSRVFHWAVDVGREYARTDGPGPLLRAKYRLADRLVFSTVKEQMGGNVEFFVSGGGSLSERLAELFEGMGLPILEGYGLTETSPVVSTNPPEDVRAGTLGPPLHGVETRIDGDAATDDRRERATGPVGELLVKGPNVTEGYWNRPEATEAAFTEDGWFRTGDIIERTGDDYLVYHDRLKRILVLDTGKNVAPGPIENEFATSDRVDQIMVMGDDEKFVSALCVPNFDGVERWAERDDVDLPEAPPAVCENEAVQRWIAEEIIEVNDEFSRHERIKEFRLVPDEWTPENDLLTPSMKLKRRNILARYEEQVRKIYGKEAAAAAVDD